MRLDKRRRLRRGGGRYIGEHVRCAFSEHETFLSLLGFGSSAFSRPARVLPPPERDVSFFTTSSCASTERVENDSDNNEHYDVPNERPRVSEPFKNRVMAFSL